MACQCACVYTCVYLHVGMLCVRAHARVPGRRGSAPGTGRTWAASTYTILSGLEIGARVGLGGPWELHGPSSRPGSGSRPDGGLALHTAS